MKFLRIALCIILFFFASIPVQASLEEPGRIWSAEAYFTWAGDIINSLSRLSVRINGNHVNPEEMGINDYTGTAHIRIPLEYEQSNLITIADGSDILFRADVFYAPSYEAGLVPEEYERYYFHIEEREETCRECHRLDIAERDKIPAHPAESICFPCHNDTFSGLAFQHEEAGINWQCLRCHDHEAAETEYSVDNLVRFAISEGARVAPLCYECHRKMEKTFAEYQYVHGPIATLRCNMCHNPHGSDIKGMLQKDPSTLCIECHRMQHIMEQPDIHEPVLKDGCKVCHDPHVSNVPFFLIDEVNQLCFKCHKKIREKKNKHPVNDHPVSAPNNPNNPGHRFSCVSCHNPHASGFDKLLPAGDMMMVCVMCHSIN